MANDNEEIKIEPISKSVRKFRWFVKLFNDHLHRVESETGNQFKIDKEILAKVFKNWLQNFQRQKPDSEELKPFFVGFAAGLMLVELLKNNPISLTKIGNAADETQPAFYWPEGYVHVSFCLELRGKVLFSDYNIMLQKSAAVDDIRTWWSFKENVAEDAAYAIGFLDVFSDSEPNWRERDIFRAERFLNSLN